ncbi:MAG: hypothetical protein WC476_01665 [Phycisphaerae bacterium]|jgi:hypothetical protein
MSQFYASIVGNRGEATRQGTKNSGITGHIRGWNTGGRVNCYYDADKKADVVEFYLTSGSNERGKSQFIARFIEGKLHDLGEIIDPQVIL